MKLRLLIQPCGLILLIVILLMTQASAQVEPAGRWYQKLEELSPDLPMNYFLLAEEIADQAVDASERELARYVFGLAGALDPNHLGRSVALALADLAADQHDRDSLNALAALLSNRADLSSVTSLSSDDIDAAAAMAIVEAFSYFRAGNGAKARIRMREPGAIELLDSPRIAYPGGAGDFLSDCELHNNVRPALSAAKVVRMLRLEHALLAGADRSWSSELVMSGGSPLIEVDPARLDDMFDVDASRPLYRDGRWVAALSDDR